MSKKIEDRYVKMSHREHVLNRPDTYIGSIVSDKFSTFIPINYQDDLKETKMEFKEVDYVPAFLKIFDEIIVNASDHAIRTNKVSFIKVKISDKEISVENDGDGIPVVMHKEHKMYVPEMIFGHLLTSENYNDNDERFVGGRNGIGAKATNIFSKKFTVETADGKKTYRQTFSKNMSEKTKPYTRKSTKSFTKITYVPDYEKFSMDKLDDISYSLMVKRVFDIAAYNPKVKVYLNGKMIPIRNFKDYMKLFSNDDNIFYENINDKWEIGVMQSPVEQFTQVSLVNGISTILGGTHVNYISNQLVNNVKPILSRGVKGVNIRLNDIKSRTLLFINCKIPNPSFNTQTKENLITRLNNSLIKDVVISDSLLKRIAKSEIFEDIVEYTKMKEELEAQKELNKEVTKRIRIDKLVDANKAGKLGQCHKCHLFLTEGDSASTFAVSGFKYTGRDFYGSFPLKGKPLNVRDTPISKMKMNEEIKKIVQILGLEFGKKYNNVLSLRYGKVVLMTDADTDGYHIKGLLINFFEVYFPELLKLDFIYEFITPVIKITKGKRKKYFYKLKEFEKWKKVNNISGYKIKYFKGLGTVTKDMSKDLFEDIDKHLIKFNYPKNNDTKNIIDLVFRKKRADDRKEWLTNYVANTKFDKLSQKTTYDSFFNNEFIEYSMGDNVRNIPSIMDGLKPTQRKILYTLFKNNLNGEINVAEAFGLVKSTAEYHHGNPSLEDGIINMAQDYVGSNNVPLLVPIGGFGTRLHGGKDNAAPRYINTQLSNITKKIYMADDSNVIDYLQGDNKIVEPNFYVPIIPFVLINGVDGIGTGWSSTIPNYNIEDIIKYIDNKLLGKKRNIKLIPYYNNFKGDVIYDAENDNCMTYGIINKINDNTLNITELPIGVWNETYYKILDELIDDKIIKNYIKDCTDEDVNITIKLTKEQLSSIDNLQDTFQLSSKINMSNMHLFNSDGKIQKYESVYDIIDDYYECRLPYYKKRKDFILKTLKDKKIKLENIIKFLKLYISNKIKINKVPLDTIIKSLEEHKIVKIDDSYNYVLNIPIYRLSKEEMDKLQSTLNELKSEIKTITDTTIEKMWHKDLLELKKELRKI